MLSEKRFLVVDDLVMNRILLCEILELLDYDYEQASNGREALDKLYSSKFDVVLMDIEMPVMNGIEATQIIKANPTLSKSIKVLGVTAHDPNMFKRDFESVTFDGFLTKPYSLDRIKKALFDLFTTISA